MSILGRQHKNYKFKLNLQGSSLWWQLAFFHAQQIIQDEKSDTTIPNVLINLFLTFIK